MHDLRVNYEKILELTKKHYRPIRSDGNFRFYPRPPKMSDMELIALNLCAEACSIDSENLLFSKLKGSYPGWYQGVGSRTRYNRRRRRLADKIMEVGKVLAEPLVKAYPVLIVDSMPCPIVKKARENRFKICREYWTTSPAKGYSAVDKSYLVGYKLHLMISGNGALVDAQLSPANVHDIHFLKGWNNKARLRSKELLGDRGYISASVQTNLFDNYKIRLCTPTRKNQKVQIKWAGEKRRNRKRIETLLSQLCDQFRIKINYAKSYRGFYTRILSKLAAVSALQLLNFENERPLNHLKHAWTG